MLNLAERQQQAAASLDQGEYNTAIGIYEECIETNPSDVTNYWHLGLATLLQGDEITAKTIWLSVFVQGSSENSEIWLAELVEFLKEVAIKYLQLGNFKLAEKICLQALELAPNTIELNYYVNICLQKRKEIDEAINYLKREIEINPNFANAYSSLAALLRDRFSGEFDQAINYLEKAIELKPDFAEAYFNMAACLQSKGQLDLAINYLEKAIELKPDFAEAHFTMGIYLRSKGRIEQAISKIQQAIQINPDLPKVLSTIEYISNCESSGYAPLIRQGCYFWDAMLFKDDNLYCLYYLIGDSSANPYWTVGKLGAAVSTDLKKWEYLGIVFEPSPACSWQSGRILAGSFYKENGVYYFFYSASPPEPLILDEGIGLAISTDGVSWQRSSEQFIKPDSQFYCTSLREGTKRHHGWRDPYVFKDPVTGKYCLFITASCHGEHPMFKGCIGLAIADKIDGPYTVLPPVAYPKVPGTEEGIHYEMERPQVIYREGKYHLFFSASTLYINPKWLNQVGREGITASCLYWYVSDKVTGPFIPSSIKPIVKGSESTDLYATSLIEAPSGQLIACGTDSTTMTLEVFGRFPVCWENGSVEILVNKACQTIPA